MFHRDKKAAGFLLLAVFLFLLDRYLKNLSFNNFSSGQELGLFGDLLKFVFVKNYFIAFSIPLGGEMLIWLIFGILIFLLYCIVKYYRKSRFFEVSLLAGIVLGALSNLADRLQYGYVIDYLDLKYFSVFNVADVMIVLGVWMFVFLTYKEN